jgi:hypothetical protein
VIRFPVGKGHFSFTTTYRPALGSTQPPIQSVPGNLSTGVKRPGREADHYLYIAPRLRMCGAIPPSPIRLYGLVLQAEPRDVSHRFHGPLFKESQTENTFTITKRWRIEIRLTVPRYFEICTQISECHAASARISKRGRDWTISEFNWFFALRYETQLEHYVKRKVHVKSTYGLRPEGDRHLIS